MKPPRKKAPNKALVFADPTGFRFAKADAYAVRAAASGKATPEQAKRFYDFVIFRAADIRSPSFRHGGIEAQRATDYAEGRRAVGLNIASLTLMSGPEIEERSTEDE